MKEQSPLFKLADLARKKGFKAKTLSTSFTMNAVLGLNKSKTFLINDICLYLLLCEIQKWLLDKHYIHIYIITDWVTWECIISRPDQPNIQVKSDDNKPYFGWDHQALEKGLQEALKLI